MSNTEPVDVTPYSPCRTCKSYVVCRFRIEFERFDVVDTLSRNQEVFLDEENRLLTSGLAMRYKPVAVISNCPFHVGGDT